MFLPFGNQLSFLYDDLQVIISENNLNPALGARSSLNFIGYQRKLRDESKTETKLTNLGNAYWEGPWYIDSWDFEFRFKNLTALQMESLIAISKRQRLNKEPCRLIDELILTREATPRTRAKKGTVNPAGSPNISGMVYFWGQYNIELLCDESSFALNHYDKFNNLSFWDVDFKATDMGLVPLTQDL